ncbi:hypothetical protein DSUL_50260 [Desulfovibrionales bacterium]
MNKTQTLNTILSTLTPTNITPTDLGLALAFGLKNFLLISLTTDQYKLSTSFAKASISSYL